MELWAKNCPVVLPKFRLPRQFMDLLHAANLRHGTDGFTSPPKEGALRTFFALKILTASAGFEPTNLGTKGQHATPRPPKPFHLLMWLLKSGHLEIYVRRSNIDDRTHKIEGRTYKTIKQI